ncbi:MAG: amidohydrolase family protein [Alphaproteobacteria bacterium]|jgi:predicted TIM-barrel fold metal-dependent hydrolase|nr:amidohydrolase family protein [Alphaproteobacteria bacterium]MBT4019419.1 amidohydrolase family protein [Alphaproteobacteria bacterium]MBT4965951.1 amidohydrolase family protein [Alphaproteobacteria bacterium]MBT5159398.1 amidohydrolase family protein [Alphaproteobacteria bacterium]MBT5920142.1 amidohydrolase family protein [Alphaproteobacteria bacterium]
MDPMKIIDAHQHFWDLQTCDLPWLTSNENIPFRYGDYSAIKKDFLVADYRACTANHNIVNTVHMEAEWNPVDPVAESRWLTKLSQAQGLPGAFVAQAWLDRDDVEDVLAGHAAFPLVRGIRQKPKAAPTPDDYVPNMPGSMMDPKFREGYALLQEHGLSYDLQIPWWHLHEAAELATDFPATQIIVNHTGLPSDRSEAGLNGWRNAIKVAAMLPNIAIKISGIGVKEQPWTVESNRQIVLDTIEVFGPDRCMFASNFPVDSVVADFDTIFNGFKTITKDFSDEDRNMMFHDNAVRIYRL